MKKEAFLKLHETKLALAIATAITAAKFIKYMFFKMFALRMPGFMGKMSYWGMHKWGWEKAKALDKAAKAATKGASQYVGCPFTHGILRMIMVFVCTFLIVWFFAWLYNYLICAKLSCGKKKKTKK